MPPSCRGVVRRVDPRGEPPCRCGGLRGSQARHAHPLELGLDGRSLLGVNAPEGRLSVFVIAGDGADHPLLSGEIPVGLAPVTVRARTPDEVWVVNEVSDSISVVSLAAQVVVATVSCPDEPADVVFAGGRAFVSCARNRRILVFEATTRALLATVPLAGLQPRSMAVDPSGRKVLVGFLNSGQRHHGDSGFAGTGARGPWESPTRTGAGDGPHCRCDRCAGEVLGAGPRPRGASRAGAGKGRVLGRARDVDLRHRGPAWNGRSLGGQYRRPESPAVRTARGRLRRQPAHPCRGRDRRHASR